MNMVFPRFIVMRPQIASKNCATMLYKRHPTEETLSEIIIFLTGIYFEIYRVDAWQCYHDMNT